MSESSFLSRFLGGVVKGCIYTLVFLIPLWFLPVTMDVLELNKQTLLVVLTLIAFIALLGKILVEKRFVFRRSWMYLVVFFFTIGYFVTSFFSQDPYLSFVGNVGQMQWSFVTVLACVLLYGVISSVIRRTAEMYHLILTFLGSSILVGLYGIFQGLGWFSLGWLSSVTAVKTFTTIGTPFALAVYMAVPLVMSASLLVLGCKDHLCILNREGASGIAAKLLVWVSLAVSIVTGAVVDFWATWAIVLFAMVVLILITYARQRTIERPRQVMIPILVCALSVVLLIWHTPVNLANSSEVSPTIQHSLQISGSVLKDRPLFGSGPGTWIYDYSLYRNVGANLSQFWTIRFDRGFSSLYTLLATVGIIGSSLWVLLILSALVTSGAYLRKTHEDAEWQVYLTIFTGWSASVFTAVVYNYNLSHHVVFWFLLALLTALVAKNAVVWENPKPAATGVVSSIFIIMSVSAIAVTWLVGQRFVADIKYASAVTAFRTQQPPSVSIEALNGAVGLNKLNDAYYRNLSQAYLLKLGQEMQGKQDTSKNSQLNTLLTSAVDTAKRATEMSPMNVDNWSNLATVYQSIASFTPGADELALAAYAEALKREPSNPVFYNERGQMYVLRADAYRTLRSSKDEKVRADAEIKARAELEKAAEQLNQAIQVKGDYAPAHFNLGIVYERQGKLKDAISKIEQVLTANNKDIGIGFQLGVLYYNDNQKDNALNIFEQILGIDSNHANARWFLATIYQEKGRINDAIAQVEKIRLQNPENQTVVKRLEELKRARDAKQAPAPAGDLPEPLNEQINGPAPLNEVKS